MFRGAFLASCLLAIAAVSGVTSCTALRYYGQAARGQMEILHQARPLEEVLADARTDQELRGQIALVKAMRAFARNELQLPVKKQFGTYADLHRKFVVWNVYAAPEFSVEAKTWWYPFIGSAKYRGYFSLFAAKDEAALLKSRGHDVALGGVRVYSTLGWFNDPVLNTFVGDKEAELAETLFHELSHARVFIPGDTDFNEAFATACSQEDVRRWLRSRGRVKALAEYERSLVQDQRVLDMLKGVRERLRKLYEQKLAPSAAGLRRAKAAILDEAVTEYRLMKQRGEAGDHYDKWVTPPMNNARLVMLATYFDLVPGFAKLLRENGGDLGKFYRAVEAMKPLAKEERRARVGFGQGRDSLATR